MARDPLVSVVMPVYNCDEYLEEAINSIIRQSFSDFEFIIIVDDPTDTTREILDRYRKKDNRISVYYQERQGLISSLNMGCSLAKGKYIARMDADDTSMPDRFEKQVRYMELNKDIDVLGTWIVYVDEKGAPVKDAHPPIDLRLIPWCLLFNDCIAHPTAMMKKAAMEKLNYYSMDALHAEDYDLWVRASSNSKIVNIPEVLLKYRIRDHSVSTVYNKQQEEASARSMSIMASRMLGINEEISSYSALRRVMRALPLDNVNEVDSVYRTIRNIYTSFIQSRPLDLYERMKVSYDTGKMLYLLSYLSFPISKKKSITIFFNAMKLNRIFLIYYPINRLVLTKLPYGAVTKIYRIKRYLCGS